MLVLSNLVSVLYLVGFTLFWTGRSLELPNSPSLFVWQVLVNHLNFFMNFQYLTFSCRFSIFSSFFLDLHPNKTKYLQVHERRNSDKMFIAQQFKKWKRTTNLHSTISLYKIDERRNIKVHILGYDIN